MPRADRPTVLFGALTALIGLCPAAQPVKPFTAELRESLYRSEADTSPRVVRIVYARRADRSFTRHAEATSPDGSRKADFIELYDAATSRHTLAEPFTRSRITFQLTRSEFAVRLENLESENCPTDAEAPNQRRTPPVQRFGKMLRHSVQEIPVGRRTWRSERWTAPDLNCFALKQVDRLGGAITESEVETLTEGDPSTSLFDIPADFAERSPREFNQLYKYRFGEAFWPDRTVANFQRMYESARP